MNNIYGAALPIDFCKSDFHEMWQDERAETATDFKNEQAKDFYCRKVSYTVGLPGLAYTYDRSSSWMHIASLKRAVANFIQVSLQACLMCCLHHSWLSGSMIAACTCESMQPKYYWLHMANDVCTAVRNCSSIEHRSQAVNNDTFFYNVRQMTDWRPSKGNQILQTVMYHFSMLIRAAMTSTTTASRIFQQLWITGSHCTLLNKSNDGKMYAARL